MARKAMTAVADLQRITGIGPAVVRRLRKAGISTCAQLAQVPSPAALAEQVPGLSARRIAREAWLQQARKLASTKEQRTPARARNHGTILRERQHYETFTVQLLLDNTNRVRGTHVEHVQSGIKKSWGDWKEAQLLDFFVQCGRLKLTLPRPGCNSSPSISPLAGPASTPTLILPAEAGSTAELDLSTESIATAEPTPPALDAGGVLSQESETKLSGKLLIGEFAILPRKSNVPSSVVHAGQMFNVHLVMDLTEVKSSPGASLGYTVTVRAKKLGQESQPVEAGKGQGLVILDKRIPCTVEATIMPSGTYRLWVEAVLTQQSEEPTARSCLPAMPITRLIQVC